MARLPRLRESFNTAEVWDKAHFLNQEELQPYAEAVAKINNTKINYVFTMAKPSLSTRYQSASREEV